MNYSELLRKANDSKLLPSEAALVLSALHRREGDLYSLLLILGRRGDPRDAPSIEPFLESHDDPMLARLAIQILCVYYDMAPRYVAELERFCRHVAWDIDNDARLMAISCAWRANDKGLLRLLLDTFEDASEDRLVREAAYRSLGHAAGDKWDKLPSAAKHFDLERDINPEVISHVRRMLGDSD